MVSAGSNPMRPCTTMVDRATSGSSRVMRLVTNGKVCTIVTSLLGAFTPFYASYAGTKAPVEHFTRAASKEFGERGISVTAIGPGPMDTPFFYPAEGAVAVAYHKTAASLSKFSKSLANGASPPAMSTSTSASLPSSCPY